MQRGNGLDRVRAADRLHARLRQAEVFDLTGADQILDRTGDLFHRHVGVDAVLIKQVDPIGSEPLERSIGNLPDTFRPAVHPRQGVPILEAELGGNHHAIPDGGERLAHQFLVGERTIRFGGIEEGHAALERIADESERLRLP